MNHNFNRPAKSPKYTNQNIVAKYLVNGYFKSLANILNQPFFGKVPENIIELGAGEGHVSEKIQDKFPESKYYITDIYPERLQLAENRLEQNDKIIFQLEDIHNLQFQDQQFDLVICCEVLEHLEHYKKAINEISRVLKSGAYLIVSVPREPIWRILNMIRFKYLNDFGNTPTHVNHWSTDQFRMMIRSHGFDEIHVKKPLPWTIMLCKKTINVVHQK